jgi:serine/threonine protein kinase
MVHAPMSSTSTSSSGSDDSSCWSTGTSDASYLSHSSSEMGQQPYFAVFSTLRRRGTGGSWETEVQHNGDKRDDDSKQPSSHQSRSRSSSRSFPWRCCAINSKRRSRTGMLSTCLLCCCFCVWVTVYIHNNQQIPSRPGLTIQQRTKLRAKRRKQGLAGQVMDGFWRILGFKNTPKEIKPKNSEVLPPECERPAWQELSFPNCNDVHDIDLGAVLKRSRSGNSKLPTGYVASGLWRSVWAVNPRSVMTEPIVLKTLRKEHEVTSRNFDRHRRDALVMERLTASPYVVNSYGFCGNSVLTEYLDSPLEDVIYEKDTVVIGAKETNITGKMRIRWALDMARGVEALHEIPEGPIVHADLQAKQFLVSPETGTIKINDFNRCRFMAKNNTTGIPCKFRIPSAPGKMRAPEEYSYSDLDEKLDMYSVANILYTILTREEAWENWSAAESQKMIQDGFIPIIKVDIPDLPPSIKETLVILNRRAYTLDPQERISAAELVSELEKLLDSLS